MWNIVLPTKKHTALLQNPAYVKGLQIADAEYAEVVKKGGATKATIYTIPVVFHVLHFGGVENISDEQILNALFILNRDYRKLNADTANVHPDFQGMPADIEVEFKLATIAPNGQCFSGITRTFSPMSYQGADGGNQVDAIVAGTMFTTGNGLETNTSIFSFVEISVALQVIPTNQVTGQQPVCKMASGFSMTTSVQSARALLARVVHLRTK